MFGGAKAPSYIYRVRLKKIKVMINSLLTLFLVVLGIVGFIAAVFFVIVLAMKVAFFAIRLVTFPIRFILGEEF